MSKNKLNPGPGKDSVEEKVTIKADVVALRDLESSLVNIVEVLEEIENAGSY